MRRFFYVTGIAAVILVAIVTAGIGVFVYSGIQLTKEGNAFAKSAVVAITSKWDADALLSRASPELTKATGSGQVRSLFDRLDALGALTDARACQSAGTQVFFNPRRKTIFEATYNCVAQYKNNSADIKIALIKIDGIWKIKGFHVNSPIFAAPTMRKV